VYSINKKGFLLTFRDVFFKVFTLENYRKVFKVFSIIPLNPIVVLDCLKI
ncbi:hypothetical protein BU23DRAFT_443823, partial [Bimuria novae-zelandiae CBS 107.79]